MASIWKCEGKAERKIARHDNPNGIQAMFQGYLSASAARGHKVKALSGFEALITRKDGSRYLLFIELMAPPSAAETGQPIGRAPGAVKAKNGKVYSVDIAAYAKAA